MTRRRIAHIPMMPATRNRIAIAMHAAAETLVLAPSSEAATEAAKLLAVMTAAIDHMAHGQDVSKSPSWQAIVSALAVMERVEARHDAGKNWGVTGDEANALRAAAAQFDHVLRLIPFNVYEAGRIFVEKALAPAPTEQPDAGRIPAFT